MFKIKPQHGSYKDFSVRRLIFLSIYENSSPSVIVLVILYSDGEVVIRLSNNLLFLRSGWLAVLGYVWRSCCELVHMSGWQVYQI